MTAAHDNSAVFHIDMLDRECAAEHDPATPWLFETDETVQAFASEAEACAAQREHRKRHGFNPMTGDHPG